MSMQVGRNGKLRFRLKRFIRLNRRHAVPLPNEELNIRNLICVREHNQQLAKECTRSMMSDWLDPHGWLDSRGWLRLEFSFSWFDKQEGLYDCVGSGEKKRAGSEIFSIVAETREKPVRYSAIWK